MGHSTSTSRRQEHVSYAAVLQHSKSPWLLTSPPAHQASQLASLQACRHFLVVRCESATLSYAIVVNSCTNHEHQHIILLIQIPSLLPKRSCWTWEG